MATTSRTISYFMMDLVIDLLQSSPIGVDRATTVMVMIWDRVMVTVRVIATVRIRVSKVLGSG